MPKRPAWLMGYSAYRAEYPSWVAAHWALRGEFSECSARQGAWSSLRLGYVSGREACRFVAAA